MFAVYFLHPKAFGSAGGGRLEAGRLDEARKAIVGNSTANLWIRPLDRGTLCFAAESAADFIK